VSETCSEGGLDLGSIQTGAYIVYHNIDSASARSAFRRESPRLPLAEHGDPPRQHQRDAGRNLRRVGHRRLADLGDAILCGQWCCRIHDLY